MENLRSKAGELGEANLVSGYPKWANKEPPFC
jgi:hypothetical protein